MYVKQREINEFVQFKMILLSVYLFTYLFVTVKTPNIYFVFSLKEARNNFRDRSKSKKDKSCPNLRMISNGSLQLRPKRRSWRLGGRDRTRYLGLCDPVLKMNIKLSNPL